MNLIFYTLLSVQTVICARILGIFPMPFYSHQSVFQPIWRELSIRGHQVTVITTDPIKNSSLTNLKEIDLSFSYKLVYEDHQMQNVFNTASNNLFFFLKRSYFAMTNMTLEHLKHSGVQELIRGENEFDLMIVETHVPAWFGLAKKYKCPVIAIASMATTNHFKRLIGYLSNPVYDENFASFFGEKLSLFLKVKRVLFEFFKEYLFSYVLYPLHQKIIRETLEDSEVDLFEIIKNLSLLFTYEIPGLNQVATCMPSVIPLNGLQIKSLKKLPNELKDFLDEATEGAIYFSLGSAVKSYLIPQEKQKILLEVFSELPYKVLWKFEKEFDDLPRNMKVVSWAPQQDILRHKNVKLFITQGGIQSIDEAIRFKVPILGVPFFADQPYNVIRVQELKIGLWIDFNCLSKEEMKNRILQAINNSTFVQNLDEMLDLLTSPSNSLEKALWWIEYVIKHKGARHLRSPLADTCFYQYYLLDVTALFVVSFVVIILVPLKLLKILQKLQHRMSLNKLKRQ